MLVRWSPRSQKDLSRLDKTLVRRIRDAVLRYAEDGYGDVKRLQGSDEEYRLRVGDWRVRFVIEDFEVRVLFVLRVLPRGSAYRD